MKVWYCFKKKRQLVKGEVDCDLAPAHKKCGWFELHPAGTRVVTGEALVIERDVAQRVIYGFMLRAATLRLADTDSVNELLDALAQSKEGEL